MPAGAQVPVVLLQNTDPAKAGIPLAQSFSDDPIASEWHKAMVRGQLLCVPDRTALACMICSNMFNLLRRYVSLSLQQRFRRVVPP